MEEFVPSMKKKYIDRLINREKQWPPCHSNKLIRLQLVEREKGEGYCANIQRGREDQTVKQTPLAYGDLFKAERGKKPVRKILVEGDAGIGKTTLSISLSEDWAREKLFQEFELLLLLPLRHKKVASACSLPELLKLLHPSSDVCKALASYMEENEAEKVLIVADGWDELSESDQQEGSYLYELLFETFPLMSVLVTSRPSASAPLHRLPCIDRFVEISGFSKEDIKEYIESEFTSDQKKASRLLEQLEDNPLVDSVCSIPLNCSIMCHLWRTLEEGLPTTMTQLYTKIILNVILRNIQKKYAFKNVLSLTDFNALPKDLQQSFRLLCGFAFQSLEKNQIVFSQEELVEFFPEGLALDEKILCFGLLQSAETVLETGHGLSFHFIHLTFMEYLAALHLVEQPQSTQLQVFSRKVNDPYTTSRFTIVWRFFFGITFSYSKVVTKYVVKQALECVRRTCNVFECHLCFCHCALEAQNTWITNEVIQLTPTFFVNPHTAHDCAAVLHVIANMEKYSGMEISFSNCSVRDTQIRTLTDILAVKQGKLQVQKLYLNSNKLSGKCVCDLFNRALDAFQSDTKSELKNESELRLVKPFPGLSELALSDNSLGVSGLQALENALYCNALSNLEYLNLSGSLTSDADTNDQWLTTFMEALSTYCHRLKTLSLSHNILGVSGAAAIARGLSKLQHHSSGSVWFSLNLVEANICDKSVQAFANSIQGVCYFNTLHLSGNDIHTAGISCLADAVCSGKIIFHYYSKLDLSDNPLEPQGISSVSRMLSSSHCQPFYVDLSACKLTYLPNASTDSLKVSDNKHTESVIDVGQQLCIMPQNCTICWLYLDRNNFTGESIHILIGFIQLCSRLEYLTCRDCGVTSDDLILLLDKLTQHKTSSPSLCNKLRSWYLVDNAIDDRGVSILIRQLPLLFPSLRYRSISLHNNPVSKEMETMLEKLRIDKDLIKQKSFTRQLEVQWSANDLDLSSKDGYSIKDDSQVDVESLSIDSIPTTRIAGSLTRQHPTDYLKEIEPSSSHTVCVGRATGESPTSCHPLEDNDKVTQSISSVGSVHFGTSTSKPLCGVLQTSPLISVCNTTNTRKDTLCVPLQDSCDNDDFFTPPSSPQPLHDEDMVMVKEVVPSLTEDDLASVQRAVWEGRAKWYNIGLELGLTPGTLDAIQKTNNYDTDSCFTATLKTWLRSGDLHPSWSGLARSLRAPPVGLERLAEQLPNLDPST